MQPLFDQWQIFVVFAVFLNPRCFAIVDRIWSVLVVRLAKRYHFKVTGLSRSVSPADYMVGIARPVLIADDAGQLFDAGNVRPRLSCSTFGLGFLLTQWAASC